MYLQATHTPTIIIMDERVEETQGYYILSSSHCPPRPMIQGAQIAFMLHT
jgi:hypothetical protein